MVSFPEFCWLNRQKLIENVSVEVLVSIICEGVNAAAVFCFIRGDQIGV